MAAQSSLARVTQGSLFVPTAPDPDKLELTIARIASIVGEGNVGSAHLLDSHRPDAFHVQKFSVSTVAGSNSRGTSKPRLAQNDLQNKSENNSPKGTAPQIALHSFRPPVPARVQLRRNKPVFASFLGRSGKVLHASGPWRTSGDWWEKPWQEDAWDLEIIFPGESKPAQGSASGSTHGFYRFSYDGLREKWFVRGFFD
jgi:protein ImuB